MIKRVYPFLLLFCLFLCLGAWLLRTFTKAQLLLAVNGHYYPLGDALLPYWTDWGDGATAITLVIALIVFARVKYGSAESWRFGLLGGLVFAIPSLLSQIIKTKFFDNEPRPAIYFSATPEVFHHVAGVHLWLVNSFPSGHTITAFSMALLLLYLLAEPSSASRRAASNRWAWSIGLFIWACSVGYSRMYLAEHFFRDVYWGAIIGVVSGMGSIWLGEWLLTFRRQTFPTHQGNQDNGSGREH